MHIGARVHLKGCDSCNSSKSIRDLRTLSKRWAKRRLVAVRQHGRTYDHTSERLTGSPLVLTTSSDLDCVEHVALSNPTAQQFGAHTLFIVQGDMGNPDRYAQGG